MLFKPISVYLCSVHVFIIALILVLSVYVNAQVGLYDMNFDFAPSTGQARTSTVLYVFMLGIS